DGIDTIGLYDARAALVYLRDSNTAGSADTTFRFGPTGSDWQAIAGDWNGDGIDTIGLYDARAGLFYLHNSNRPGSADTTFRFGPTGSEWQAIVGDWNGDGIDTIGLFDAQSATLYLRDSLTSGPAEYPDGDGLVLATGELTLLGQHGLAWESIA
ncbi:FG-GAP repeat domain-containing protein, partial [Thiorhodococcus fuscus]